MIRQLLTYRDGCTDPHRNLATEAYLTETVPEDTCILYLWQNRHTVVIGRNQNAWRECRTTLLEQEGGVLARRLSGGGAVYHDMGNLNFTFSLPTADYDLRRQQEVLVAACRRLGIPAECSGRNDILTGGRKFSGNSFYHHGGRSFHNGTLLIDVDMEKLGRYLAPSQGKLESKGVASVRSRVVNLSQIQPGLTVSHMEEALWAAFSEVYGLPTRRLEPSRLDQAALERHYQRFHSYDWVYGQAMPCTFSCGERFPWGELTLELAVEGGVCRHAAVWTDAMDESFAQPLARGLEGCPFRVEDLCHRVEEALLSAFSSLTRGPQTEPEPPRRFAAPSQPRLVTEEMDVTQGKLSMGFRCDTDDEPAMILTNLMFGGSSNSKLFLNVREKLSLCYYASSTYVRSKGILTVSSGIETADYDRAEAEILRQLDEIRQGLWEDWELTAARESLLSALQALGDSQGALENYYLGLAATGRRETPEEMAALLRQVTPERIRAAAQSVQLDTIYFLKGKEA